MLQKYKFLAVAFACCALVGTILDLAPAPSAAAVRTHDKITSAPKSAGPDQTANAELLKRIDDLEKRVASLENGEREESKGPQAQMLLPPNPPITIPQTLRDQITSLTNDVKALQSQLSALQQQVAAETLKYESEITNVGNALHTLTQQVSSGGAALAAGQAALQTLQKQFAGHTHNVTVSRTSLNDGSMGMQTILHCGGYGQSCTATTPMNDITTFVVTGPPQASGDMTQATSGPIFH